MLKQQIQGDPPSPPSPPPPPPSHAAKSAPSSSTDQVDGSFVNRALDLGDLGSPITGTGWGGRRQHSESRMRASELLRTAEVHGIGEQQADAEIAKLLRIQTGGSAF